MLNQLQTLVNTTEQTRNKKHQVFEPSFDCKECRSDKFVLQKINYIHNNAVTEKAKLVEQPEQYKHSSALQYFNGNVASYKVFHYMDLQNIELDKD